MQTPTLAYAKGITEARWQADTAQQAILPILDRIHRDFIAAEDSSLLAKLRQQFSKTQTIKGLYLWGGVGRGKTFLIDLLYDCLPGKRKLRLHFHRFMEQIHQALRSHENIRDPLQIIARQFVKETQIFCLDEFFVQDIGDAMILAGFLKHLFEAGGTLLTSSNLPPHRLYEHGLQRARFLPAIDWITKYCEVVELQSATDYRLRTLTSANIYYVPLGEPAEQALNETFHRLAAIPACRMDVIQVHGRSIPIKKYADGISWFEFSALCEGPRAVADYIELARSFNTVLISNVPIFQASNVLEDAAKRFIHLIDEFYDRNVKLILSAAALPNALYQGERHQQEFSRTESRLIEMQSIDYLAREHRA